MPAIRKTELQRRDTAFQEAFARGKAGRSLDDYTIADSLGVSRQSLSTYRRLGPWKMSFDTFCKLAKRVGMTGPEVCRIIGVPYKDPDHT